MAKWLYRMTLFAGFLIAIGTTLASTAGFSADMSSQPASPGQEKQWFPWAIFALSLFSTFVYGWNTFIDPTAKWTNLRGAALALESEIWKFRTRSGQYALHRKAGAKFQRVEMAEFASMTAEKMLHDSLILLRQSAAEAAGLKHTAFFSDQGSYKNRHMLKHHQYKPLKGNGPGSLDPGDDFHSPAGAADYIRNRLRKELAFYRGRLPTYVYWRWVNQLFIISGNIASLVLVTIGMPSLVIVATVTVTAVGAYMEFTGVQSKIQRYSQSIENLSSMQLWWHSLHPMEKASLKNIDDLVVNTEIILQAEWGGWLSTAAGKQKEEEEEATAEPIQGKKAL